MQANPQSTPEHHSAFEFLGSQFIESLNLGIDEYRHKGTGARHFHMQADDNNNGFLVAFLTVPRDSTGVAHILEHTSLCGSERFPVRDPFFMMIRRSLNTFMNAFTSTDWTAYPFASQNRKDFYNLMQVYLDATFFPRLEYLDFAQEGHRVEFASADDPATPLVYKGVVYNEMKGAMSPPTSQVWHTLQSQVFPTVTYHYNSGGDPMEIPKLTYEQLKGFHARHYHPSNAVFMTYGNMPVADHQAMMEERALSRFSAQDMDLSVPDEQRYATPQSIQAPYALDGEKDLTEKTHVVMGWLLGHNADPWEMLTAHLLTGVLMDNGSCPLRHALETTDLGTAPSELCGLDDSTREMMFVCGLEGSEAERAEAVEDLVIGVLREVAENGLPKEQVESILHQLELQQREISGGGFPYGLHLMVNALAPTLHGGDPVDTLNIDPVLERLRSAIDDPQFIKDLVRTSLLDNPHRVRLTMTPDAELNASRAEQERKRLDALKAAMDEAEKQRVVELAAKLEQRQNTQDDPELLPKVGIEDIPPTLHIAEGETTEVAGLPGHWYAQGTNGMVYQQVVVDIPDLGPDLMDALPLLCECVSEVGSGGRDYLATQARQAAVTGGIGARYSVRAMVDDADRNHGVFVVSGKALQRNHDNLAELVQQTFAAARFDELPRLRELVAQTRAAREMSVTNHGHALAMTAASAGMNGVGALAHRWGGLLGIHQLKQLDDGLDEQDRLAGFADRMHQVYQGLAKGKRQLLIVGEASQRDTILQGIADHWAGMAAAANGAQPFRARADKAKIREAWVTTTQVNFCAKAYPAVSLAHPDAPALTVLGGFLRNGFLHRAIREQGGAYGGGASYDADTASFRFYSYRDPRLGETLGDFDRSVEWLLDTAHPARTLEEAILGVIGGIDRPSSPAGEAIGAFFNTLHGRTPEQRRSFRRSILGVTLDDLKRVGETWLKPEQASIAVITDPATLEAHGELGLQARQL